MRKINYSRVSTLKLSTGLNKTMSVSSGQDTISLAPDADFTDNQKNAVSAVTVLDIATTAISQQPVFQDLKDVPYLKEHQESSKRDAEIWRANVRPALFSVNDTIINFNAEFNAFYNPLYEFAGQLSVSEKCKDAQANLIAGLQALQEILREQKKKVSDATKQMNTLRESMLKNESDLNADLIQIKAIYEGDEGKIEDLNNLISSYSEAMSRDLTMIGLGATGIVVGALTVAVGVALCVESVGGSTPVIVVGIGMIAGAGGAMGYGIYDYNTSSNEKAEALQELSLINAEMAVATSLTDSVSLLVGYLETASAALEKLSGAWDQLDRDYQNLIDALRNTQGNAEKTTPLAFIVQANLEASKTQWNILFDDANRIKDNLLAPMTIDTTALDNSDGKNPSLPDVPTIPKSHVFLKLDATVSKPSSLKQLNLLTNSGYSSWIDNVSKSLFSFQEDMATLSRNDKYPAQLQQAQLNLTNISKPAIHAAEEFLSLNEKLSAQASLLRQTALLGDNEITEQGLAVFEKTARIAEEGKKKGQIASQYVSKLDSTINSVDAALLTWLHTMQAQQSSEKQKLQDAIRLRNKAQSDKEKIKNDYWFCFFGAIACAAIAIEVNVRISNAQSEINKFNKSITSMDKDLSGLMETINTTTALTANAAVLEKSIDGGLKAIQVILATIEGIRTSTGLLPYIIRAHLLAVAEQIEGVSTIRLRQASQKLFIMIRQEDALKPSLNESLQRLFSSALLIQNSSILITKQPRLVYVENLLKENQALLNGHALEWLMTYSNNILSEFSTLRALGQNMQVLGENVLKLFDQGEIENVLAGIEALIDLFTPYLGKSFQEGRHFRDTLSIRLFNENIKNDHTCFYIVEDILRQQLEETELQSMDLLEDSYTLLINQKLEELVTNSTRVISEYVTAGVVLGISMGIGQIQFAATEASMLMYLVKKGANIAIKKGSEAASSKVKEEIKKIERKGEDVETIINDRCKNLKNLAELEADISILKILVNDVKIIREHTELLLATLEEIRYQVMNDIEILNAAKYTIQGSEPTKSRESLEGLFKRWYEISLLTDSFENSFLSSLENTDITV